MHRQASVGSQVPVPAGLPREGCHLAKVMTTIPEEHAVMVVLAALSSVGTETVTTRIQDRGIKAKVMEHRAGRFVGDLDLPRRGDWGIVVFPQDSDQLAIWLGCIYEEMDTLASPAREERRSHHDSGTWWRVGQDGTIELAHPSGTYIRIGTGTALSARTRQERQGNERREVPYPVTETGAPTVYFQHASGASFQIEPTGRTKVESSDATWVIDPDGTVTFTVPDGKLAYLGGQGGADFIALRKALEDLTTQFAAHVHAFTKPGNASEFSGIPRDPLLILTPDVHFTEKSKAT